MDSLILVMEVEVEEEVLEPYSSLKRFQRTFQLTFKNFVVKLETPFSNLKLILLIRLNLFLLSHPLELSLEESESVHHMRIEGQVEDHYHECIVIVVDSTKFIGIESIFPIGSSHYQRFFFDSHCLFPKFGE